MSSSRQAPASPVATTSAILGASSAGWSPQRSPNRSARRHMATGSDAGDKTPSDFGSEYGSPSRIPVPEHRANLGNLRSHGLVSNSIFKNGSNNPSPEMSGYSPSQSPSRYSPSRNMNIGGTRATQSTTGTASSPSHQQRFGVGLGISATQNRGSTFSPSKANLTTRSTSNSSLNSSQSMSDAENEGQSIIRSSHSSPRKSTNFRRLEQANYVSNSPFRKVNGFENPQQDEGDVKNSNNEAVEVYNPTHDSQQNYSSDYTVRPRTPEKTPERMATAYAQGDVGTPMSNGTPRTGRQGVMSNGSVDSPSSGRGLLVSNRLHGPRSMLDNAGSATNSPLESPTKRERRKTVTFDEVLDVQEFDRESSFDHESMQSASSTSGSLEGAQAQLHRENSEGSNSDDDAMWLQSDRGAQKVVEKLMVINASPETNSSTFSTPELNQKGEAQYDLHVSQRSQEPLNDSSSNDSRELSSIDEPQSPRLGDVSLTHSEDKAYHSTMHGNTYQDGAYIEGDSDISGGNLSAYGALHRVESMVDELLGDELLDGNLKQQFTQKSTQKPQQFNPEVPSAIQHHIPSPMQNQGNLDMQEFDTCDSPPRRRRKAGPKLGADSPKKSLPVGQVPLSLPEWSPLLREDISNSTAVVSENARNRFVAGRTTGTSIPSNSAKAEPIQSPRTNARPHISRDAVLQRVAREKALQQQQQQEHEVIDSSDSSKQGSDAKSIGQAKSSFTSSRRSEPEHTQVQYNEMRGQVVPEAIEAERMTGKEIRISAQQGRPTRQATSDDRCSPLERLASELDAEVAAEAQRNQKERRDEENVQKQDSQPVATSSNKQPAIESQSETLEKPLLQADVTQDGFESGLRRELSRIYRQSDSKYHVKDRGAFTSLVAPQLGRPVGMVKEESDPSLAGQNSTKQEGGKAWRRLRRPSDMNEYAQEMREYRAKENPKKVAGKVFVMVDSFTPAGLPVPSKPTRFYCVLDNGLHVVRTSTAGLRTNGPSKIGQEFELIQHRNLTFSLTLVVQRDNHLQEPPANGNADSSPSSSMKRDRISPSFSRGVGKLFSSPKKRQAGSIYGSSASIVDQARPFDPIMAFMNREGAFGQTEVVFEEISQNCLAQCHVMELPVNAVAEPPLQPSEQQATFSDIHNINNGNPVHSRSPVLAAEFSRHFNKVRGTLRLKVFYLPPMPGIPKSSLPESLSDCIKGMESARWHAGQPWMEGTLTQLGGDCQSWRRRPVKAQGAHLIGFNEITKKPTVKIDLSKAISIEENHDPHKKIGGKVSEQDDEEFDETYHVERSFRITFKDGERIFFFADTDEEMHRWLNALSKIVGNAQIPKQFAWSQLALDILQSKQKSSSVNVNDKSKRIDPPSTKSSTSTSPNPNKQLLQKQGTLSPTREQDEQIEGHV